MTTTLFDSAEFFSLVANQEAETGELLGADLLEADFDYDQAEWAWERSQSQF